MGQTLLGARIPLRPHLDTQIVEPSNAFCATTENQRIKIAARKGITFYLKVGVSAVLTVYVFGKVGWLEFLSIVRNADPLFILLSFAISPILIYVSVVKWYILLRAKSIIVPQQRLFGLYLLGTFFNILLPSNVGGDVIRGYNLGRETGKLEEALGSVFVERMTGLSSHLIFVLFALLLHLQLLEDPRITAALGIAFVGYGGVLWLALDPRLLVLCVTQRKLLLLTKLARKLHKLQSAIRSYHHTSGLWLPVMGLSLLFYLLAIVNVYLGCLAFGHDVSYTALTIAVPIILAISMLPISLGGLGIQELGYFVVFEHVGIPGPLGLSVALLIRTKGIVLGGIGGLLYAKWARRDEVPHESTSV